MKEKRPMRTCGALRLAAVLVAAVLMLAGLPVTAQAAEVSAWDQLQAAIDSGVETSFTLTGNIVADGSVSRPLTFPGGKEWVLDLNGYTLDRARASEDTVGQVIVVEQNATLTIKDSSGTNRGRITGGWAKSNGAGIYVYGTLCLEGGTVTGNVSGEAGGGIYSRGGTIRISGGAVTGNRANLHGGGIFTDESAVVEISGGTVSGNQSLLDGGGIFMKNSTLTMTGGTVSGNGAATDGAGIFLKGTAAELSGVTLRGNIAQGSGGAAYLSNQSTMTVSGAQILHNSAKSKGAAIAVEDSSCTVTGSEIEYNVGAGPEDDMLYSQNGTLDTADCTLRNVRFVTSWKEIQDLANLAMTATDTRFALAQDITAPSSGEPLRFPGAGIDWVLDLNGHTLSRNLDAKKDNGHVLVVQKGGTLTVLDSSGNNSGKITGGYSGNGGGIYVYGTLYFEGGTLTRNSAAYHGGGIYAEGGAVHIRGGVILDNVSLQDGGGLYLCESSALTMDGGTVKENRADLGGGIYLTQSGFEIKNVEISENSAISEGGGLYVANGENNTVVNTVFRANEAGPMGGGVRVCEKASLTMTGCTFRENTCINNGGAVYVGGTLNMEHCTVEDGKAVFGGGIYAVENSTLQFTGGRICGNSGGSGAGITLYKASATIRDAVLSGNKAEEDGGAVFTMNSFLEADSRLVMENCTVSGNSAKNGGGLSLYTDAVLTNCRIEGNSATDIGGGVWADVEENIGKAETVRFNSTEFLNNTAQTGGALYAQSKGHVVLHECSVRGNQADRAGGGVYTCNYTKLALLGADIEENTARMTGSGVYAADTIVSMKGRVVINNNFETGGYPEQKDLVLVNTSYISSPGLYEGSYIHVGTNKSSVETAYVLNISRYQTKYFHIDSDFVNFTSKDSVKTPIVASLFGGTAGKLAIGVAAALAAVGAAVLIVKKKKKKNPAQENEPEKGGEVSHDEED